MPSIRFENLDNTYLLSCVFSWIFSSLPENKQMLALSATYPESLAQHLTRYMREPTFVRLNPKDMGLKGKFVILSGKSHDIYLKHIVVIFKSCPSKKLSTGFVPEIIFFPLMLCFFVPNRFEAVLQACALPLFTSQSF